MNYCGCACLKLQGCLGITYATSLLGYQDPERGGDLGTILLRHRRKGNFYPSRAKTVCVEKTFGDVSPVTDPWEPPPASQHPGHSHLSTATQKHVHAHWDPQQPWFYDETLLSWSEMMQQAWTPDPRWTTQLLSLENWNRETAHMGKIAERWGRRGSSREAHELGSERVLLFSSLLTSVSLGLFFDFRGYYLSVFKEIPPCTLAHSKSVSDICHQIS